MTPMLSWLAQETSATSAWSDVFSNVFGLTVLFIFLSAIIGAIVSRRRKDRCLKLFDDYHVTMQMESGRVIWGDLRVYAQGVAMEYDAPYQTSRGLIKSQYLLYEQEMKQVLAFTRYVGDLTEQEQIDRRRQVETRSRPGPVRRLRRSIRNLFNAIHDAFVQALSAFVGQMARARVVGGVVQTQQGRVESIGRTLLGAGNAYEPMLERHIGSPVVLELTNPVDPDTRTCELPGYLAEYSERYLALFNVEQPIDQALVLPVSERSEAEGVRIDVEKDRIEITNLDDTPLIIEGLSSESTGENRDLDIVLTNGASAKLARIEGDDLCVRLLRVRQIDLVCPRDHAIVRYASLNRLPDNGRKNLPPAHEDQKVAFP